MPHFSLKTNLFFLTLNVYNSIIFGKYKEVRTFPVAQTVKRLSAMRETWVCSLGCADPLEKEMAAHSSIPLAWSHGQRSLISYSPWGCKGSEMTETSLSLSFIKS